jgi:hypothetical protein
LREKLEKIFQYCPIQGSCIYGSSISSKNNKK